MEQTIKISAIMTAARSENTWARNQIEKALKTMSIPFTVSGGVFYGQCMQRMMESLCGTGCEYIITIDGDSIFTAKQLERLLMIIAQENKIDAICPAQVRRGKPDMLGSIDGVKEVEWSGYPVKMTTGHFGLTVIDVRKLEQTPKPWFWAKPDKDGRWEGDKIDDDIYFWLNWRDAGNSLYCDPGTRIGHLEEMIAIHDEKMQVQHMYPADWCDE